MGTGKTVTKKRVVKKKAAKKRSPKQRGATDSIGAGLIRWLQMHMSKKKTTKKKAAARGAKLKAKKRPRKMAIK